MEINLARKLEWGIAKWLEKPVGEPLGDLPSSQWIEPPFRLVKNKTSRVHVSRGGKKEPIRHVEKLYYRGPRLHHEIAEVHVNKAVMKFRGKGFKIERRQKRRKKD